MIEVLIHILTLATMLLPAAACVCADYRGTYSQHYPRAFLASITLSHQLYCFLAHRTQPSTLRIPRHGTITTQPNDSPT